MSKLVTRMGYDRWVPGLTPHPGIWMIPSPCPAIYDSAEMKGYRSGCRQAVMKDGFDQGQLLLDDITDYYLTPHDLGYGRFVDLNHEYVGREALAKMADDPGGQGR